MKILYIHQYFNTPEMPGSTRSYEFAKKLVNSGHVVYMLTSDWQHRSKESFSDIEGIKVFWAPIKYSNKMGFYRRIFSFLLFIIFVLKKGFSLNFNIVFASSTPLTVGIPALIFKKIKKVKFIFEVRDMWPQIPIEMGILKSRTNIFLMRFLEKYIYDKSDSIIALSQGMKNEILKITPLSKDKIKVITNLCHINEFNINKKHGEIFRREKLNISNQPLIIYTGSFGRINNVVYLVEIAEELKKIDSNIKFLIAGGGFQKKKLYQMSKELNLLNESVFLKDYINKDLLPQVLSSATIVSSLFIDLFSMRNNSANKFFDGLAAGKPIMINYDGWQSDLIRNFKIGFKISKNNPKEAALKIKDIINDSNLILEMSKNSRKLSKEFSVNSNCDKFLKLIERTLESENRVPNL